MRKEDIPEFAQIFYSAMGAYPTYTAGKNAMEAYFRTLADFELPLIQQAFRDCVRHSTQFPPTASAVRKACSSILRRTRPQVADYLPEAPPQFDPVPDKPWGELTGAQRGAALAKSWDSWRGPVTDAEASRRLGQLYTLVDGPNPL